MLDLKEVPRAYASTSRASIKRFINDANPFQHGKQLAQILLDFPKKMIKSNKIKK